MAEVYLINVEHNSVCPVKCSEQSLRIIELARQQCGSIIHLTTKDGKPLEVPTRRVALSLAEATARCLEFKARTMI